MSGSNLPFLAPSVNFNEVFGKTINDSMYVDVPQYNGRGARYWINTLLKVGNPPTRYTKRREDIEYVIADMERIHAGSNFVLQSIVNHVLRIKREDYETGNYERAAKRLEKLIGFYLFYEDELAKEGKSIGYDPIGLKRGGTRSRRDTHSRRDTRSRGDTRSRRDTRTTRTSRTSRTKRSSRSTRPFSR
jgi:hypothetical protein